MKEILRWFGAIVCFGLLAILIGTLIPRPFFPVTKDSNYSSGRVVLLLSNPIHTDIAFPADPDVLEKLAFLGLAGLPIDNPNVKWIILGWGGQSFFIETPTWADLKPMPMFRALTIDKSVMHPVLAGTILPNGKDVFAINLDAKAFDAMLSKALEGFALDAAEAPKLIAGAEYGEFDRFYEGTGAFNALIGCNTWTASVLRAGGLQTGVWNMLPFSLGVSLKMWNGCENNVLQCEAPA